MSDAIIAITVLGGSFAGGWFVAKLYYANKFKEVLLRDMQNKMKKSA